MVSRWRDRAAFTGYMRSPKHHTTPVGIDPSVKDAIVSERRAHLHKHEVEAD